MEDKKTKKLITRVRERLQAGSLVTVIQEADEQLAVESAIPAASLWGAPVVRSVTAEDVMDILSNIPKNDGGVWIFVDFLSVYGENPVAVRQIREVALQVYLKKEDLKQSRLILIEQPWVKIPQGLLGDCEVIQAVLPTTQELCTEVQTFLDLQKQAGRPIELEGNGETIFKLGSALSGLARHEAFRLCGQCFVESSTLDASWLRREKASRITTRLQSALTFEKVSAIRIGGYDLLKADILLKKQAFNNRKALDYGLDCPRGIVLYGPPGTGKTKVSQYIAELMELPLLGADIGKLFGSLVGQSEAQARMMTEVIEACAPCCVRIDEMEKGLSSGGLDGGTSKRVVGTLLTWLAEHQAPVFCVATVNGMGELPPELTRPGRFDAVYFMDLPDAMELREIVEIHLTKRGKTLEPDKINALAEEMAVKGFSGAEAEQAVKDGMYKSFAENRQPAYEDIRSALKYIVPVSVSAKDKIDVGRAWGLKNARPSSSKGNTSTQDFTSPGVAPRRPRIDN